MKRHNLLQLAIDNAAKSKKLRAEAGTNESTIYLHGVIGGWWGDIDETEFAKALESITADKVHLRIDSPGGDVFAARAMMTAISQHSATFIAHVDGMAASAATGICMACDEVEISQGAQFMIHNAWSIEIGSKADMHKMGDLLAKIDDGLVRDYATRTGKDSSEITTWMDEETWFTADEAVSNGFADRAVEVVKGKKAQAWNLSAYKHPPANKAAPETEPEPIEPEIEAACADRERRLALLELAPA